MCGSSVSGFNVPRRLQRISISLLCAIKFVFASLLRQDVTGMRADGSNPVGFLLPKMAFCGDLGDFEGSDGGIVRLDGESGSWVAKKSLFGVLAGN